MTDSSAAIAAAEAITTSEDPRASYHLELAKDQLALAKPLVEGSRKEKRLARDLLDRAEVDADLAMSLALTAEVREQADSAWKEVRKFKGE